MGFYPLLLPTLHAACRSVRPHPLVAHVVSGSKLGGKDAWMMRTLQRVVTLPRGYLAEGAFCFLISLKSAPQVVDRESRSKEVADFSITWLVRCDEAVADAEVNHDQCAGAGRSRVRSSR